MSLSDYKVIVTGGPTREWIDPVRYISNPSSGKMGIAIADEAHKRNCKTTLVHGPISEELLKGKSFDIVSIETTGELLDEVLEQIQEKTVLIMAAAPADYKPANRADQKIKKTESELLIRLEKNPDILKNVVNKIEQQAIDHVFVVGFAAETNDVEKHALSKLEAKKLNMICLNDVTRNGAGFGGDTNIITIFKKDGSKIELPRMTKEEAARNILDQIELDLK